MSKNQRRKGNAQCASSSKAAELLQQSGLNIPFLGFGSDHLFPQTSDLGVNFEFSSEIHPEVLVIFKKLAKRDSITKEKALRELKNLLEGIDPDQVKISFSYFCPVYQRLVTDPLLTIRALANANLSAYIQILKSKTSSNDLKETLPYLLFSFQDSSTQVLRSAEDVVTQCFSNEKQPLLYRNFASECLRIAIEILNRQHRLVLPQLYPDDETDPQRQARLITQSFSTIGRFFSLVEESDQLEIMEELSKPGILSSVMSSSNEKVKESFFGVIQQLLASENVKDIPPSFFDSKFLTAAMNNIDASNVQLCRNCLHCILLLSNRDREKFFEVCKLKKALIPKMLSTIRKKGLHWNALESTLLSIFSLIFESLDSDANRTNWTFSCLDSFFDGSLDSISLSLLVKLFTEIIQYLISYQHPLQEEAQLDLQLIFSKIIRLFEYAIDNGPNNTESNLNLAKFLQWLNEQSQDEGKDIKIRSKDFRSFLTLLKNLLLSKLPSSELLIIQLLPQLENHFELLKELICEKQISTKLFLHVLEANDNFDCLLNVTSNLGDLILNRLESNEKSVNIDLLKRLIKLLAMEAGSMSQRRLTEIIDINDFHMAMNLVCSLSQTALTEKLLVQDERHSITSCILHGLLDESEVEISDSHLELFSKWLCDSLDTQQIRRFLDQIYQSDFFSNANSIARILLVILESQKFPSDYMQAFAQRLLNGLLNEHIAEFHKVLQILPMLEVDDRSMMNIFERFVSDETTNFEKINRVFPIIARLEHLGKPLAEYWSIFDLADIFDDLFTFQILATNELFIHFLLTTNRQDVSLKASYSCPSDRTAFKNLLNIAKRASCLVNISNIYASDQFFNYIFLSATYIKFYIHNTTNFREFAELQPYHFQFNNYLEGKLDEHRLAALYCTFVEHDIYDNGSTPSSLPFSIPCAIRFAVFEKSLDPGKLIEQISTTCSISSSSKTTIDQLAIYLQQLDDEADLCEAISSHKSFNSFDKQLVFWLIRFELASANFTEENRAKHFVTLSEFIEQQRSAFEDWLFTVNGNDILHDLFSCSVLRFCVKVVPHFAEVDGGPIRDFINCGFLTALQDTTDSFSKPIPDEKGTTKISPFQFLLASFSLDLATVYLNCIRLNITNSDYRDIRQEWEEFFGPSTTNFLVSWFIQLFATNQYKNNPPPSYFTQGLCRSIHFLDPKMVLNVELPANLKTFEKSTAVVPTLEESLIRYPENLCNLLLQTFCILLNSLADAQLAAAFLLKCAIFDMFTYESSAAQTSEDFQIEQLQDESITLDSINLEESSSSSPDKNYDPDAENEEEPTDEKNKNIPNEKNFEKRLPEIFRILLNRQQFLQNYKPSEEGPSILPELLAWDILINFLSELDPISRISYCDTIDLKLVFPLLERIYTMLPQNPGTGVSREHKSSEDIFTEGIRAQHLRLFNPEHYICNLFYRTLGTIPATVRDWYKSLSKQAAFSVNKYTKKYVSRLVIQREMRNISNMRRGKLEVRVIPSVSEVECSYRMEESEMRLTISLPHDYPLEPPKIETERSIVSKDLHRKWLFQLDVFISRQNGYLLDGILQWKRNIDQHLKGVDDCTICMMTVSSTNYQLPKIRCKQCRKKFHGDCLHKWFNTSQKTTCPLCRANFI